MIRERMSNAESEEVVSVSSRAGDNPFWAIIRVRVRRIRYRQSLLDCTVRRHNYELIEQTAKLN